MLIGSTVIYKKELDSSFDYIKSNVDYFSDGTSVLCDSIKQARGRNGRKWHVDEGQVLLTILLKPSINDASVLVNLGMALSIGLLKSFSPLPVSFKWPNDIILAEKKVAGMLIKPVWKGGNLQAVAVGIGINLNNHFSPQHELYMIATSVRDVIGSAYDKLYFLENLFSSLDENYKLFLKGHYVTLHENWCSNQRLFGKKVRMQLPDSEFIEGVVSSFLPDGSIQIVCSTSARVYVVPFYLAESLVHIE